MSLRSPAYNRQLRRQREKDRTQDRETGGWIFCPCSFAPGMTVQAMQIMRRPAKNGSETTFASCDRCQLTIRFYGSVWSGEPSAAALTKTDANAFGPALAALKESLEARP